ncbi:MAG TPA: hypothetical protein VKD22_15075 [Ramlibacter sp.]|nr:hypothetical protein [Ramlibacter sp.]
MGPTYSMPGIVQPKDAVKNYKAALPQGYGMPGQIGGTSPFAQNMANFGANFGGASPFSVGAGVSGLGGAIQKAAGGVGGAIGDATDWLTDKDQGLNRLAMLNSLIGTGLTAYGAYKQGKREDEQTDRDRGRDSALAPYYAKLLKELGS